MNKIYATDECTDMVAFLQILADYEVDGKIKWSEVGVDTYQIMAVDLSLEEVVELTSALYQLDIYPLMEEEEEDDLYYEEEDDNDDYYGSSRRSRLDNDDDF